MALVSMRQLLDHAAENNYGVPAFNVNNLEQVQAIMEAASKTSSPVIMQASAGAGMFSYLFSSDDQFIDQNGISLYKDDGEMFTTFGGSIGLGGKLTTRGGFVFESTLGFQLWTPPPSNFNEDFVEANPGYAFGDAANIALFYLGPGFPLMYQMKFGFNF